MKIKSINDILPCSLFIIPIFPSIFSLPSSNLYSLCLFRWAWGCLFVFQFQYCLCLTCNFFDISSKPAINWWRKMQVLHAAPCEETCAYNFLIPNRSPLAWELGGRTTSVSCYRVNNLFFKTCYQTIHRSNVVCPFFTICSKTTPCWLCQINQ